MTRNDSIKKGFITKAASYGIKKEQALYLFKQANLELAGQLGTHVGDYLGGNLIGPGMLAGGAIGGLTGLMDGTPDENGETHRFRNALTNAGIGAGIGGAAGYGAGILNQGGAFMDAIKNGYKAPNNISLSKLPQFQLNNVAPPTK